MMKPINSDKYPKNTVNYLKLVVFILCLLPLGELGGRFWFDWLGANPIEMILHHTGDWTLRLLLLTLAISPLRDSYPGLIGLRRMLGLWVFFYACLHLSAYIVLEQFFDWSAIFADVLARPYIFVGMLAFMILIPLAITSSHAMMRRMGKNWQRLHRLVYVAAIASVLHFMWLVKAVALWEPLIYAVLLGLLLGWRIKKWIMRTAILQQNRR